MATDGGPTGVLRDPLGGSTPIVGHLIQSGETLTKIARQYGTTIDEILRLNQDNKQAIKSPDLIIAGQVIRVPYKQPSQPKPEVQASAGVLSGQPKTADEINKQTQNILQKYEALKQGLPTEIKPEDVQPLMMYMFGDMTRQIQETEAKYREILDPTYYQRQYQQFLDQSGIPQLYQRYFDLNKILNGTRDDVLREAQAVGGIVTQSQIEEVVNWRTSIIKSEMQTLADMIELKEKSLDRMMKYVELDRKTYSNYLDNILGITEKKQKIIMDAFKWNLDWQNEIIKRNTQKLDTALRSGALADYSDELLLEKANPDSFLYSGYTLQELFALRNAARLIQEKKQEEIRKMQEQLERQRQQMEISRERLQFERERLELQKEKKEEKKPKINLIDFKP
jgi:LysM repeat protein